MDGGVVEPVPPQLVQVTPRHFMLRVRELCCQPAERAIRGGKVGSVPIVGDRVNERVCRVFGVELIGDLGTEVVGVGQRSVAAP